MNQLRILVVVLFYTLVSPSAKAINVSAGTEFQLSVNARTITEDIRGPISPQTVGYGVYLNGLVSGFTIGPHDVRLLFGGGNPGVAYNFDDPIFGNFDHSAYHDWVMDVKVGTGAYTVTVDNSIVLNGIGETTLLPNQVRFGDGSSNGRAESELTSLGLTSSNSKIIDLKFDSLPTAQGWSLDTTAGVEEANVFSVANGVLTMNTLGEDYDVGAMYFSAVPIPAAAWLFGSGLLGLVGIARRKKA